MQEDDDEGTRKMAFKRQRGNDVSVEDSEISSNMSTGNKEEGDRGMGELPGPSVGGGPPWRLNVDNIDTTMEQEGAMQRCRKLLDQALSCSELAEVRFVFDDGKSLVHGHWAMLCEVCEVFREMKGIAMDEWKKDEVRVVGISRESFRGFLEWLYTGKAGQEMARADGREVWLLAERYQVDGIKQWLMEGGLHGNGVCAAIEYALQGDGEGREDLLKACRSAKWLEWTIKNVREEDLCGVSVLVLQEVLEGHGSVDRTLYARSIARYRLVERWARANGIVCLHQEGEGKAEMDALLTSLNLSSLPVAFLRDVVTVSGLVSPDTVSAVLERRLEEGEGRIGNSTYDVTRTYTIQEPQHFGRITCIALSRDCERQRVAVLDTETFCVQVHDVESGACLTKLHPLNLGNGQMRSKPWWLALGNNEELIVTDMENHQIVIFDCQGVNVRHFGRHGRRNGEFNNPRGVAVNDEGHIIVCDSSNHRVQVFQEDGTFVRNFGQRGDQPGEFKRPDQVAVGSDNRIVVMDLKHRIHVFDPVGNFLNMINPHEGITAVFQRLPCGMAVGTQGEILFSLGNGNVRVFTAEGKYVQTIDRNPLEGMDIYESKVIAVDLNGRIFGLDFTVELDTKLGDSGIPWYKYASIVVQARVDIT